MRPASPPYSLAHSACGFCHFGLSGLYFHVGFLQQSFGLVDLVLQEVQLRAPTHILVGVRRCQGDRQPPLDRLAHPCDLALVVDDGSTKLARVPPSRAIGPGLDQKVTTWCWTRGIILAPPKPCVSLSPRHSLRVTQQINGNLIAHVQSGQRCSQMEDALHQQFDSNGFGIVVIFRCDVRWVPRCRPVAYLVSKTRWSLSRGFPSDPSVAKYRQSSPRSVVPGI